MHLTITTDDERVVSVEIDEGELVDSLKAILSVETGVPIADQEIAFEGNVLNSMDVLSGKGVADGDLLLMTRKSPQVRQTSFGQQSMEDMMQSILNDRGMMATMEANNPDLAAAIRSGDVETFSGAVGALKNRQKELEEEERKLRLDPFNVEAQKRIEELIREKNVEENFSKAMEYTPEVFGSVSMLYVNMEVNNVPVQAFVDSGAQVTIMTAEFATKCGLMRLVDKRFQGVAMGVGESKIIGRVHQCPLKVKSSYVTSSITILEQKSGPQFIFGLDNMSRHQCCIDLKNNKLRFGTCNEELDFLPEYEVSGSNRFSEQQKPVEANAPGSSGNVQPPAASTQPVAPPPAQSSVSPEIEAKAIDLMSLGFDKQRCIEALIAANGNEDVAASFLFGEFDSSLGGGQ